MSKRIAIVSFYYLLGTMSSCFFRCDEVDFPFFDFSSFRINTQPLQIDGRKTDTLLVEVSSDELEYLSSTQGSIFSSAFALEECPGNGSHGFKYRISSIDFLLLDSASKTSNQGESILNLITPVSYGYQNTIKFHRQGEWNIQHDNYEGGFSFVVAVPKFDSTLVETHLKVVIEKENGSAAEGEVMLTW